MRDSRRRSGSSLLPTGQSAKAACRRAWQGAHLSPNTSCSSRQACPCLVFRHQLVPCPSTIRGSLIVPCGSGPWPKYLHVRSSVRAVGHEQHAFRPVPDCIALPSPASSQYCAVCKQHPSSVKAAPGRHETCGQDTLESELKNRKVPLVRSRASSHDHRPCHRDRSTGWFPHTFSSFSSYFQEVPCRAPGRRSTTEC